MSRPLLATMPAGASTLPVAPSVSPRHPRIPSGTSSGPTRGAFLETDRKPRRWQYGSTYAYFAEIGGRNHELKTGYLGWRNMTETINIGYPNQQQYRYRSVTGDPGCNEASNYDGCFTRPDSVLVYDYPNTTASGEWYNSAFFDAGGRLDLEPEGLRRPALLPRQQAQSHRHRLSQSEAGHHHQRHGAGPPRAR